MERLDRANVIIRAFRAVDNPELCLRFIEGHEKVLTSIGVDKLTSADYSWMKNPAAYVVLCTSLDGQKAYGGARVHVCGGNQELPLVSGVIEMDPTINEKVNAAKPMGTGELCGLWNSLEVAGMGIGAIYVVRAAVAIISQLGIRSCFALCSPMGAKISKRFGYEIRKDIGNKGTFYYPKQDLLATMVFLEDALNLSGTPEDEKAKILELRDNPDLQIIEVNRGKEANITYDLDLEKVDKLVYDLG
ncbi:MAG: hypothetical protein R2813_07335 [Flavobacteriales bacterium]